SIAQEKQKILIRREQAAENIAKESGKTKAEVMEIQKMTETEVNKLEGEAKVEAKKVRAQTEMNEVDERIAKAKDKIKSAQESLDAEIAAGTISAEEAAQKQEKIKTAMAKLKTWAASVKEGKQIIQNIK
ncbi:MAG: hypothetical protein HRT74_04525, partial [Flavobacteriales bacterium]|nr:hypothetical protein [Flavobacteriales bacterium]